MKAFSNIVIFAAVLAAFTGCGKKNESGKSGNGICLQYDVNGRCISQASNAYTSGNNINLAGYLSQIQCMVSQGGYGMPMGRTQQTMTVQTGSLAQRGQSYLGVTSLGDIAIVVGNGTMQAQMTVYLCAGQQMGPIQGPVILGEYTSPACPIKVITAATLGGTYGPAIRFRDPRAGTGTGAPYSFCRY